MFSQTFNSLPQDVANYCIINKLDKQDLYSLRLVNHEMVKFVSKTYAGGIIKNVIKLRPHSFVRYILGEKAFDQSFDHKLTIIGLFDPLITSFINGAISSLYLQEFSIMNMFVNGLKFSAAVLGIACMNSIFLSILLSYAGIVGDLNLFQNLSSPGTAIIHKFSALLSSQIVGYEFKSLRTNFVFNFRNSALTFLECLPISSFITCSIFYDKKNDHIEKEKKSFEKKMTKTLNIKI